MSQAERMEKCFDSSDPEASARSITPRQSGRGVTGRARWADLHAAKTSTKGKIAISLDSTNPPTVGSF